MIAGRLLRTLPAIRIIEDCTAVLVIDGLAPLDNDRTYMTYHISSGIQYTIAWKLATKIVQNRPSFQAMSGSISKIRSFLIAVCHMP
jgi:hypothetical protein